MNTIDKWVTTATIHDQERRRLWSQVFPGATFPIKSILTSKANLPGLPNADVYMLDLEAITDEQREGLIMVIANTFCLPIDEVRSEIDLGVPILAEGVSASTADQGLFFSLMDDDEWMRDERAGSEEEWQDDYPDEDDCS
jgi:hypothetical protein